VISVNDVSINLAKPKLSQKSKLTKRRYFAEKGGHKLVADNPLKLSVNAAIGCSYLL